MRFTTFTLLAGAGLVSAQSLSSGCKTALTNIVASPDAACLNPTALVSLVTGGTNASIVDPINNWLTGLCSQGLCTNATLSAVATNITSGCSTELSAAGLSTSDPSTLISTVQEAYPTVRQAVCLKDTSANALCATSLLTSIQSSVGTLSVSNLLQIIPNIISGSASIPKNVTCSDCVKQAINLAKSSQFGSLISGASGTLSSTCGASFTDGATPSDVTELATSTSTSTSASGSGAVSLFASNSIVALAMSGLVVVSSAFTILA